MRTLTEWRAAWRLSGRSMTRQAEYQRYLVQLAERVQLDEATLSDVLDFVADGTTPSIRRRRARATLARVTIKVPRRPPTDRVVYADDTWGCLCREHGYAGTWDDGRRALHPARGVPGSGIRPGAFVAFVMCG
jgi:hypothetical protein